METQPTGKVISKGICTFCKAEFAKNKMTQHLKFCKQRLASIASEEEKSQETKTRLFHILAEGEYNPQYWLHFEVPASEPLWSLDDFLKDMWIDDLDHLSGFTINGTDYSNDYPEDFFSFSGEEVVEEEEEEEEEKDLSEEEQIAKLRELIDKTVTEYMGSDGSLMGIPFRESPLLAEWLAGIKEPRSVDELIDFLKEERPKVEKELRRVRSHYREMPSEEFRRASLTAQFQKIIVESLLDEIEDRSMGVSLGRVLKVGQKFSYVYDYGSSTNVNLKVIAEREGIVQDEKDSVRLLAQNTAPAFTCIVCGKPATTVEIGYYRGSIAGSAYCTECAEEQVEEGRTLPIINSPRVGVL